MDSSQIKDTVQPLITNTSHHIQVDAQDSLQTPLTGDQALFMFVSMFLATMVIGSIVIGLYKGATIAMRQRKKKIVLKMIRDLGNVEVVTWDRNGIPTLISHINTNKDNKTKRTFKYI